MNGAQTNNHICKVCDSANIKPEKTVGVRLRYKCLDCNTLFFEEELTFEINNPSSISLTQPEKIYYCKHCDYKTPGKYKIVSHYASEHSWWHRKEESVEVPTRKIYYKAGPQLGDFSMLVTGDDLAKLDDEDFGQLWLLLGQVIRNRFVEVESDIELADNRVEK